MTDSVMFSKERGNEPGSEAENSSDYYYDDSTGYRIYKPEDEDDDSDFEDESQEET